MPRIRLLVVTYLFPPMGGIAVQRILNFVKYLPKDRYEIHVLTTKSAATETADPALLEQVPRDIAVHRVFTPEVPGVIRFALQGWLSRRGGPVSPAGTKTSRPNLIARWMRALIGHILCPDAEVAWLPLAVRAGQRLVARYNIDVVLTTAPPFSVFLIGNRLKERNPRLRLISDFRDEWLDWYYDTLAFHKDAYTRRRAEEIEASTVALSDTVLTVTDTVVARLRSRYPAEVPGKFTMIPNGYAPETFRDFRPRKHGTGAIVVTHIGTVYESSSPRDYLDAVDQLPDDFRSRVETRFVGRVTVLEKATLEGRRSQIKQLGFLPQAEALRWAEETDFLLLVLTIPNLISGKLYEYLAMRKLILAVTPLDGEVARLIRSTGTGWCAEPGDASAIAKMLVEAFRDNQRPQRDEEAIRQFERPRLTQLLDAKIRQLVSGAPPREPPLVADVKPDRPAGS